MAYQTVNLPALVTASSGSTVTNGIGSLDDAERIILYMTSSAGTGSSGTPGLMIQVSQFDPAITDPTGVTQSTAWHTYSTNLFPAGVTSSGGAHIIVASGFRGLRLAGLTSASATETIARVAKQVVVT